MTVPVYAKTILVDLDGTLCDCSHRVHHVLHKAKNWDAFFAGIPNDSPNGPLKDLIQFLTFHSAMVPPFNRPKFWVVLCSGRPDNYRESTEAWLEKHGIDYDALYMRASGDFRPDHIVKREILMQIRADGYNPILVIDDRQSVVDMWRSEGLVCLQCAPSEETIALDQWGELVLMVGPSGAGKTTYLQGTYEPPEYDRRILSSDQFRIEFAGSIQDQSMNAHVFTTIRRLAKARLMSGLPVVIDATNIKRKDRLENTSLVPSTVPVKYFVVDRPLNEKLRDRGWRDESVIRRHHNTFQSNMKDILSGDGLPNVSVVDMIEYDHDRPVRA